MSLKTIFKKVCILLFFYFCIMLINSFIYYMLFIIIHEAAHYICGSILGYTYLSAGIIPSGIYLNFKEEFIKPLDDIIISVSGPLINFVFFVVFYFLSKIGYNRFDVLRDINILLCIFNLLPVSFLDGGRILKNIVMQNINFYMAHFIVNFNGFIFGLLAVALSIIKDINFSSVILMILGITFIIKSYINHEKITYDIIHDAVQKLGYSKVRQKFAIKSLAYSKNAKLLDIIKIFCFNKYYLIYIIEEGNIEKNFSEKDIINTYCNHGNISICDYMEMKKKKEEM